MDDSFEVRNGPQTRHAPSILGANLLYLATFVLLFLGSLVIAGLALGWHVWINELVWIGGPLAVYLLVTRQRPREAFRLRSVSGQVVLLSLLFGLGIWYLDGWIGAAFQSLLDYTIPLPPEVLNTTLPQKLAMAIATILLAPVMEEFLFRGVIQQAYERLGPLTAITASVILFVMIHQELAQSLAILPVSLGLAYVAWRTQSVIPAILIHLANNLQPGLFSLFIEAEPQTINVIPSPLIGLFGGLIAATALWLLIRATPRPTLTRQVPQRSWLARMWPLIPTVPIYATIAGLGVLIGAYPEALSFGAPVELEAAPWKGESHWRYEIRNTVGETIGEAECTLVPQSATFALKCEMFQSAFEAAGPTGTLWEDAVAQRQTILWDREMLALDAAEIVAVLGNEPDRAEVEVRVQEDELLVGTGQAAATPREGDQASLTDEPSACYDLSGETGADSTPPSQEDCLTGNPFLTGGGSLTPLMVGDWPWRFSALPFQLLYSRNAMLVWPYRSIEEAEGYAPVKDIVPVVVRTSEEIVTPLAKFVTWRVTVGDEYTAWYQVDPPHTMVAYNDGLVTWLLAGAN